MGPVLQRNCAAVQGLYTCQDLGRTRSAAVAGLPGLQHSTAQLRCGALCMQPWLDAPALQ